MAPPRVFVSSTWYDLKYIRENLAFFVRSLGYEPVLSEEGSVYFDPSLEVREAAIAEVPNCQLFVLVIGGRFGSEIEATGLSITNTEYEKAAALKIPIFALVEQAVHSDYSVFLANEAAGQLDADKIVYPSVDSHKIFEFIREVRGHAVNNALVPFRDFGDIEGYLKQQWAGMVFAFLTGINEERRVADTLSMITEMNERIEMLSDQILRSVGTQHAKLTVELYNLMLSSEAIRDLAYVGLKPTPASVLLNASYRTCSKSLGKQLQVNEGDRGSSISRSGPTISRPRFDSNSMGYKRLRQSMLSLLDERGTNAAVFIKGAAY
jgi:hypothetical protein